MMLDMGFFSRRQINSGAAAVRIEWKEYRLLFYSALIGVAGGLGAQLFVWLLNSAEHILLVGIAGYQPPEASVLNPEPVIGSWGLWLIPVVTTLGGHLSGILVYTFAPRRKDTGRTPQWRHTAIKAGENQAPIAPLVGAGSSAITIASRGVGSTLRES